MIAEEETSTAPKYFDLAYTYSARLEKPTLVLMAGLTGTGKSVLANSLAPRIGAEIIRSDILRKEMLQIAPTDRHPEAFGKGIYEDETTRKTYDKALELASEKLARGKVGHHRCNLQEQQGSSKGSHGGRKTKD